MSKYSCVYLYHHHYYNCPTVTFYDMQPCLRMFFFLFLHTLVLFFSIVEDKSSFLIWRQCNIITSNLRDMCWSAKTHNLALQYLVEQSNCHFTFSSKILVVYTNDMRRRRKRNVPVYSRHRLMVNSELCQRWNFPAGLSSLSLPWLTW